MSAKNKLQNWFWEYTYNNWKLTPKSQRVVIGAAGIVAAGLITALIINGKK
jgi:hypothetical protein